VPQVIRIEKSNEVTGRDADAQVSRGRRSLIGLPDVADLIAKSSNDSGGAVRGSVIGDNNLQRSIGLSQNATQSVTEITLTVKDRNNTTNERLFH
jgi:hypothetical protein